MQIRVLEISVGTLFLRWLGWSFGKVIFLVAGGIQGYFMGRKGMVGMACIGWDGI